MLRFALLCFCLPFLLLLAAQTHTLRHQPAKPCGSSPHFDPHARGMGPQRQTMRAAIIRKSNC